MEIKGKHKGTTVSFRLPSSVLGRGRLPFSPSFPIFLQECRNVRLTGESYKFCQISSQCPFLGHLSFLCPRPNCQWSNPLLPYFLLGCFGEIFIFVLKNCALLPKCNGEQFHFVEKGHSLFHKPFFFLEK